MDLYELGLADRTTRSLVRQLRAQSRPVQIGAVVVGVVLLVVALLDRPSTSRTRFDVPAVTRVARTSVPLTADAPATTVAPTSVPAIATSVPAIATSVPATAATSMPASATPGTVMAPAPDRRADVVAFALAQVGKPYRFGAAGPHAFDCSGLTRAAYQRAGVELPHYATWQADQGRAVQLGRDQVAPGDLVFTRGGRPRHDLGHVGLAVSPWEWVVAPAPGRSVERAPIPFDSVQRVRRLDL